MTVNGFRERAVSTLQRLQPSLGAAKLLGRLARRDVDVHELIDVVQKDPLIAGRVLQLANSGAFGRLRSIQTVQHAIAFLGPSVLRRHALTWTVGGMLKRFGNPKSCPVTRFTMHSEAVAVLADVLCDHLPVDFPDGAYVAGLIHDVGRLVIAHMCGELAADFIAKQVLAGVPVTECERNVLGIDHAEVSGIAAAMWQLPEPVGNAVHFHHSPPAADGENSVLPLALVLAKADTFVNALGLSITPDVPLPEPRIEIAGHESQIREALKTFETMLRQNQAYASSANN